MCSRDTRVHMSKRHRRPCVQETPASICPRDTRPCVQETRVLVSKRHPRPRVQETPASLCPRDTRVHVSKRHQRPCVQEKHASMCPRDPHVHVSKRPPRADIYFYQRHYAIVGNTGYYCVCHNHVLSRYKREPHSNVTKYSTKNRITITSASKLHEAINSVNRPIYTDECFALICAKRSKLFVQYVFISKSTGAVISSNSVLEERRKVNSVQQTLFYHNVRSKGAVEHLRYRLRIYPGELRKATKTCHIGPRVDILNWEIPS
jgi:hypothetical protein